MERYCKIILFLLFPLYLFGQGGPYTHSTPQGNLYYLSPTGNDTNPGTQASPWLSPNHNINCGDVIIASASTAYAAANFASGKWGTVTCASGNNMAVLYCATFDGCKITATGTNFGMYVSASYWAVINWEVTVPSTGFTCFAAAPLSSGATAGIHHILFANDVANGCGGGSFSAFNVGTFSVDYFAVVGDIAYNGAQNSLNCYSGISVFQPKNLDTVVGTHLFIAGNFSYGNVEPSTCASASAPGADGIILDTLDGSQGLGQVFTGQSYVLNNIAVANSGRGLEQQSYTKNVASSGVSYFVNNTSWGNETGNFINTSLCPEMAINLAYGVVANANISQATISTGCPTSGGTNTVRAFNAYDTSSTTTPSGVASSVSGNLLFAASGSATFSFNDETPPNSFTFGANTTTTNPAFTAPSAPGAPSCGTSSNVPNCMATVISNFTPTAIGFSAYGYQAASTTINGSDTKYPHWLCVSGLPGGLITPSC